MERLALRQAEVQIWELIQAAAPRCEAVRLINPWNKLAGPMDLPIGRLGQGLLSWIPEHRLQKIRSASAGLLQGDRLQVLLVHSPAAPAPIPVDMTLLVRSSWSRAGIPLSEAMQWPGGVLLGKEEGMEVLPYEVDYYGLWLRPEEGRGRMLLFSAEAGRRFQVEALGDRLQDPEFQSEYLRYAALDMKSPRHCRSFYCGEPDRDMLLLPKEAGSILPRPTTRLFPDHWVLEVLNRETPIPLTTKEAPWAPSPTSQSTEPDDN